MNAQTKKQGFTIIEVVLVLAIAALIFLMIFIALPALQRGQRDTARKQDVGTIASAVNTFRSNNRGTVTGLTSGTLTTKYIDNLSQVDNSTSGVTVVSGAGTGPTSADKATVYLGAKCGTGTTASQAVTTGASLRQAAVITFLENGGAYCQDA